jgi:hypothetical protein
MKEKDFQILFSKWIDDNYHYDSAVWELKICKLKSMPFDQVKPHQIKALQKAKSGGLYHKINDMPIFKGSKMRFTNPKPFDCFFVSGVKAFVVIWFYKPRQEKEMIWIDIEEFLKEEETCGRKSLTEERAKELGIIIKLNEK